MVLRMRQSPDTAESQIGRTLLVLFAFPVEGSWNAADGRRKTPTVSEALAKYGAIGCPSCTSQGGFANLILPTSNTDMVVTRSMFMGARMRWIFGVAVIVALFWIALPLPLVAQGGFVSQADRFALYTACAAVNVEGRS